MTTQTRLIDDAEAAEIMAAVCDLFGGVMDANPAPVLASEPITPIAVYASALSESTIRQATVVMAAPQPAAPSTSDSAAASACTPTRYAALLAGITVLASIGVIVVTVAAVIALAGLAWLPTAVFMATASLFVGALLIAAGIFR